MHEKTTHPGTSRQSVFSLLLVTYLAAGVVTLQIFYPRLSIAFTCMMSFFNAHYFNEIRHLFLGLEVNEQPRICCY